MAYSRREHRMTAFAALPRCRRQAHESDASGAGMGAAARAGEDRRRHRPDDTTATAAAKRSDGSGGGRSPRDAALENFRPAPPAAASLFLPGDLPPGPRAPGQIGF